MESESGASLSRQSSLPHGSRKFYDIDSTATGREHEVEQQDGFEQSRVHGTEPGTDIPCIPKDGQDLLQYIQSSIIGKDKVFVGPYGRKKVEYCDYTASGRSLSFLEDYIRDHVLSDYGNTHTTTSVCSLQTTLFRHEARDIIRNAVNAGEHDVVIFESSGCTGAIHKLIHALDLSQPPIVIVSPYEHHSNLLPWREMGSKVIRVQETADGQIDLDHLEDILKRQQMVGRQVIGSFAAASNVTGILVDVHQVTALCHRYDALAMWDYATAAPYVHIDVNPVIPGINPDLVSKDAVFISAHKFVGGVQTPGILIAKKKLFRNSVPYIPGGGTVFFVRRQAQRYLQEVEVREEGGTPAIVESIRAGLVFQLKEAVGSKVIDAREKQLVSSALKRWESCSQLKLLGSRTVPRLPVFSFLVVHPQTGLYLHHNYTCVLLNDLFGIQARGGCACAGPYAEDLLGIAEPLAKKYEELLVENTALDRKHLRRYREYSHREILRPGFARLNLPYFLDEATAEFILEAVSMVAEHGWKLLPQYNFNPETGEWRHKDHQVFRDRTWLGHVTYKQGHMTNRAHSHAKWIERTKEAPHGHEDCIRQAKEIFDLSTKFRAHLPDQTVIFDEEAEKLRWFLLPSEALECLQGAPMLGGGSKPSPFQVVSYPRKICESTRELTWECVGKVNTEDGNQPKMEELSIDGNVIEHSRKSFAEGLTHALDHGYIEGTQEKLQPTVGDQVMDDVCDNEKVTIGLIHNANTDVVADSLLHEKVSAKDINEAQIIDHVETEVCEPVHTAEEHQAVDVKESSTQEGHTVRTPSHDQKESAQEVHSAESQESTPSVKPQHSAAVTCPIRKAKNTELEAIGHRWHPPPKTIFKPFIQALEDYPMIENGDRVLACLSGGKDSLSMLHSLHQYQFYCKKKGIQFELGAVTIDPQSSSYDPSPLKAYLKELGVTYYYEEQCILDTAQSLPYECASICSFCSRMKRGRIYHTARREHYNVLALGQHLDDLAESFLMSVFHNGNLRTMKACYTVEAGDLRVIRPFVYVRETDLRRFAEQNKLPVIAENCPACFEAPKERHHMKQLLAAQEIVHPHLFPSILSAIKPIMSISQTQVNLRSVMKQFVVKERGESADIDEV